MVMRSYMAGKCAKQIRSFSFLQMGRVAPIVKPRLLPEVPLPVFCRPFSKSLFGGESKLFSPSHELQDVKEKERVEGLHHTIKQEIKMSGNSPMSLARFMEVALMDPRFGYYSTKETIFNKGGDFTTSPEISQMFGEMIGIWFVTALKNYNPKTKDIEKISGQTENNYDLMPKDLKSINLVEIGPGTGIMMCDVLRTLKQFTGNLRNVHINLIEASPNLRKVQQDKLLKYLQEKLNIFLSYQVPPKSDQSESKVVIDRFKNKDQNFTINWYPSLSDYYNEYLKNKLDYMSDLTAKGKKQNVKDSKKQKAKFELKNPCFVIAHELFDALPIHKFHFSERREWCEKVVTINPETDQLEFSITDLPTENTVSKLQPDKYFSDEAKLDLKPGDSIEICSEAVSLTKDICNLLELSQGMGLVIDYGENHSFSNSFRGLKNHKLVKDEADILRNIGNIDLTTYVNFMQIAEVAKTNKQSKFPS